MKDIISHFEPTSIPLLSLKEILEHSFPDAKVKYAPISDSWKIKVAGYTHVIEFNSNKQSKLTTKAKKNLKEVLARIIVILLVFLPIFFLVRRFQINPDYIWIVIFLFAFGFDYLFNYVWDKIYPNYRNEIQSEHSVALTKLSKLAEGHGDLNFSILKTE